KSVVRVHPHENVFREEKVTLTCDIQETRDWWYNWYKDGNCRGSLYSLYSNPYHSEFSEGVKLTVS
ncbi:hypothetical protein M9458_055505, partial [Cirrhinus mrigala]